ncbi:MAG: PilZ domain-containing protein [Deferrisomatales bacterium]
MTRKPLWVRVLGWVLWLPVVGMPLQAVVLFGHSPLEVTAIWAKLAPQNQLVMALSATAALGVTRVARWGWGAALAFVIVALWNNWVVLRFPAPMPRWTVGAASACTAFLGLWLLRPSVYRFFHAQTLHWWRAAPRHPMCAPAELVRADGIRLQGAVFNLSRTGLFLRGAPAGVEPGEVVQVRVWCDDRTFSRRARVVRVASAVGAHPEGVGLRFAPVPFLDRLGVRVPALTGALPLPCRVPAPRVVSRSRAPGADPPRRG